MGEAKRRRKPSKIEWTGKTWNPVLGCKPISPGCKNCYAEQMSGRCAAMGNEAYTGLTRRGANGKTYLFTGDFRELPDRLDEPLKRQKPTTYFVNSMSDLFGEGVSDEFIAAVFGVMAACPQHTFQVLTKRADRLPKWCEWIADMGEELLASVGETPPPTTSATGSACVSYFNDTRAIKEWLPASAYNHAPWPLPNVHLGVSVENRKHGLQRINELRKVPAAVRFLSIEPLLEDLGEIDLTGISWVIVGGESGRGARECKAEWFRNIIRQCRAQGIPVFVKQGGAKFSDEKNGVAGRSLKLPKESAKLLARRLTHPNGGDLNELPEDIRIREIPTPRIRVAQRPLSA